MQVVFAGIVVVAHLIGSLLALLLGNVWPCVATGAAAPTLLTGWYRKTVVEQ
jgi:hypothetical protein